MANIFFRSIVLVILIVITQVNCTTLSKRNSESEFEGYIFFDNRMFNNVDNSGFPINEVQGNDSIFISVHRKMFIHGCHLIDVRQNVNFADGKYRKIDTIGYEFYNFSTQKFASLEMLTLDSKVLKKGSMADDGGGFSNTPTFDPMNGINDSAWKITDTIINGDTVGVMSFIIQNASDSVDRELSKRAKFWINYKIKNSPVQMSYILSKKVKKGFVYKMQLPSPDGKSVMVTSFDYQPTKLSDTLTRIFDKWSKLVN